MSSLKIYLVSNPKRDYETYTDMVIAAFDENNARQISYQANLLDQDVENYDFGLNNRLWVSDTSLLKVKLLGFADSSIKKGIILEVFKEG